MGFGFRIFLIEETNKIIRIPVTRFDRLLDRDSKESLPQYRNSRIRYATVILELENRKPISIARIEYGYLKFDSKGQVDQKFLDAEWATAGNMLPEIPFYGEPTSVVHAAHKFAQKKFKHEFTWSPSSELEQSIIQKTFK